MMCKMQNTQCTKLSQLLFEDPRGSKKGSATVERVPQVSTMGVFRFTAFEYTYVGTEIHSPLTIVKTNRSF